MVNTRKLVFHFGRGIAILIRLSLRSLSSCIFPPLWFNVNGSVLVYTSLLNEKGNRSAHSCNQRVTENFYLLRFHGSAFMSAISVCVSASQSWKPRQGEMIFKEAEVGV